MQDVVREKCVCGAGDGAVGQGAGEAHDVMNGVNVWEY